MTNIIAHMVSKNLTVEKAAKRAGMTPERFEQVSGGAKATLGEMRGIAKALQIPVASLMEREREAAEPIKMLFRQTLEQRDAVEVTSHVDVLSAQVRDALSIARDLPSDLTWLNIFNGMEPTPDNASAFANLFRQNFGGLDDLEPFPDLARVLSAMGVLLLFSRDPSVEGVSAIVNGHAIVIIGPRTFKPRMLFTIAHELGHLVAHHEQRAQGYAHLDKEADWSRSPRRAEEKFADAFASAILLPKHGVLSALKVVREHLESQSSRWGPLRSPGLRIYFTSASKLPLGASKPSACCQLVAHVLSINACRMTSRTLRNLPPTLAYRHAKTL